MYLARYTEPKLTGVVVKEAVRCGKENCRCAKGKLHRWYYYHYFRQFEDGEWKLKKRYITRPKVKYLRRKIREKKRGENQTKAKLATNMFILAKTSGYIKGKIPTGDYLKALNEIT